MRWGIALCALWLTACVQSGAMTCADGRVCPADYVCDDAHGGCATNAQVSVCQGKGEGATCTAPGVEAGACYESVCLPAGCGNGAIEPQEVCDDRQWVFTVPKLLRLVLARDPAWRSWTGGLVVRAIGAWQRRVARKRGIRSSLTGAVTFVQRFGGLVNLNVHYHLVIPDGVFVKNGEALRFEMLPVPTNAEVLAILDRIMPDRSPTRSAAASRPSASLAEGRPQRGPVSPML